MNKLTVIALCLMACGTLLMYGPPKDAPDAPKKQSKGEILAQRLAAYQAGEESSDPLVTLIARGETLELANQLLAGANPNGIENGQDYRPLEYARLMGDQFALDLLRDFAVQNSAARLTYD